MDLKDLAIRNPDLIEWHSESIGTVYVFWFSLKVQSELSKKYERLGDAEPDEFVRTLISLVCAPKNDKDSDIRIQANETLKLSESELEEFSLIFVTNNQDIFPTKGASFSNKVEELHNGLTIYIDESIKRMKNLTDRFRLESPLSRVSRDLIRESTRLSRTIDFAKYDRLISNAKLIDAQQSIRATAMSKALVEHDSIRRALESITTLNSSSKLIASIDTQALFRDTLANQARLVSMQKSNFGALIGATDKFNSEISKSLSSMTSSYRGVVNIIPRISDLDLPFVTTYVPNEYSLELEAIERISVESDDDDAPVSDSPLSSALQTFDEGLIQLWDGAWVALYSDNPDKVRHVTTSAREMLTHTLHRLAPDREIYAWSADEALYHQRRPTRRARLLYICRHFSQEPMSKFVEDDVRAALSLINELSAGTHVIQSNLTNEQLSAILYRIESLMLFLLRISQRTSNGI